MPKVQVDFAGPSYFGGKNDELILCAGKGMWWSRFHFSAYWTLRPAGDIHIWDRESGALLHHIRAQTLGGDLTCIAWNHAHDSFMFATGSHDGAVRIWTAPDAPSIDEPYPSRGPTNPTNTPARTPSPFDVEYRTDSPATQLGGDSQDDHNQSSLQVDRADSSGSRRTVVFSWSGDTSSILFYECKSIDPTVFLVMSNATILWIWMYSCYRVISVELHRSNCCSPYNRRRHPIDSQRKGLRCMAGHSS